jgi:signal transduction histidine kinase
MASSVRDVTGRRSLEAALRAANDELNRRNEQVERASRMKTDFLAGMSHELRTPLNSIIGFSEILQDGKAGPVNEQQREFLGDVLDGARRLLQLISDLLDLSKIEAGKLAMRLDRVDLGGLLQRTAAQLRPLAARRSIRVELEHDPATDGVWADPDRLQQILQNFASNAFKFSGEGSTVRIRTRQQGAEYRLEVQDQGIGISAQDQERLFADFVQLDAGEAREHQGTGLGLALCRRIAEAHGGRVGVVSAPGQGSLFFAQMPRKPPALD